jgi:hypothetical protein
MTAKSTPARIVSNITIGRANTVHTTADNDGVHATCGASMRRNGHRGGSTPTTRPATCRACAKSAGTPAAQAATLVVVLNETITSVPDYDGHWRGQAYITHHVYGEQVHRYTGDAERWNRTQAGLRPASAGATCPDCGTAAAVQAIDEHRRRVEWSSPAAVWGDR